MSKLKDLKNTNLRGASKFIHRVNSFLESDKAKRWAIILLAVFMVCLMVFAVLVPMIG